MKNICDSVIIEANAAGVNIENAVTEAIKTGTRKTLFEEIIFLSARLAPRDVQWPK